MPADYIDLFYLLAAVLFIFGLKGLSHPSTAVRGNLLGSSGMLLAIVVTLLDRRVVSFEVIVAGIVVGGLIGAIMAYRVSMNAMPQVVAVFQGDEFYRRQREMMAEAVSDSDVVITTAAIPGRPAPVLITGEMVGGMRSGSVVLDLAAESGGNCELTRPGETVEVDGVSILGPINVASTVPYHASQMFARNVTAFLQELVTDGELQLDMENPILSDTLITHEGEVVNPRVRELLGMPDTAATADERSSS